MYSFRLESLLKAGIQVVNFFGFLKERSGRVPIPKPRRVYSGHYDTLLHILKVHPNLDFKEYLPSVKGKTKFLSGKYLTFYLQL